MRTSSWDTTGHELTNVAWAIAPARIQASAAASPAATNPLLSLQRTVGNHAVVAMLSRAAPGKKEPTVGDVTSHLGPGRPLESEELRKLEAATAAKLDRVRLHHGVAADKLARAFDAKAFTLGTDIVLAHGEQVATDEGKRLLAHEIAHVVQQGIQPAPTAQRLEIGAVNDPAEQQAESVSNRIMSRSTSTALQRRSSGGGPSPILRRAPRSGTQRGLTIEATPEGVSVARLQRGEAERAVADYIDRYLETTITQSHRLAYLEFRSWYRAYKAARALAEHSVAEAVCKWVFKRAINLIFPEEAIAEGAAEEAITATAQAMLKLPETIKEKSEAALEFALEHLKPNETGNIEQFLDSVGLAEERAITKLLEAGPEFRKANPALMNRAIDEFAFARMDPDKPWPTVDDVPPNVKAILASAGIGSPGPAAATRAAERWLAAHIRAVHESDEAYRTGRAAWDEDVVAMISALRQMGAFENRQRIYRLEQRIPSFFRSMVNINSDSGAIMHIRLGVDRDDADAIVANRPYASTDELVTKKVLTSARYEAIRHLTVAVPD